MWIRTIGWLQLVVLGFLLLSGSAVRADDAGRLAAADTLIAELKSARVAKDVDAVGKGLERVRGVHDGIQDPDRRTALRVAVGLLLRVEDLESVHRKALATLASLDDAVGAYAQMRRCLPSTRDTRLHALGRHVLAVLRVNPLEVALQRVSDLAAKARTNDVRRAAIQALGSYGASPKRISVVRLLLGLLKRTQPPKNLYQAGSWVTGWYEVGVPIIESLCRLTGQKETDPAAWMARSGRKPRDLESLFDPAHALDPVPAVEGTPWRRMRTRLGSPRGPAADAVGRALRWLAAHQSPPGHWQAAGFHNWCEGRAQSGDHGRGLGNAIYDVGVTGLALTAFLVAGHDGSGSHEYDAVVRRGLAWLLSVQDDEGCIGARVRSSVAQVDEIRPGLAGFGTRRPSPPKIRVSTDRRTYVYNHAAATLALIEAAALTGSSSLEAAAQRALDFIELTRNPYFAWRYGIKPGDNDSSVTAWMILTLGTARLIDVVHLREYRRPPFLVDAGAFHGAKAWLDKATDPDYGRVGYVTRGTGPTRQRDLIDRFPPGMSEALTAGGMLTRMFLGENPKKSRLLRICADLCAARPPRWNPSDGSMDMYYWYFGTLAMRQMGGRYAKDWEKAVTTTLPENQHKTGDVCALLGSWDPRGAWGLAGGRVYSTALNTLTLLAPSRYPVSR